MDVFVDLLPASSFAKIIISVSLALGRVSRLGAVGELLELVPDSIHY